MLRLAIAQLRPRQGRLRGEPLPARRLLPGGGGLGGAARPGRGAGDRAHRLLPRGRRARSRRLRRPALRRPLPPAPRRQGAAASTSPSASTSCTRTGSTTPALYATLGGSRRRASATSTARCSFRPTASSTRSGSSRRGGACRRSTRRWGRAAILICEDAWHSFTPMLAALDGAQLIIVPSASPARGIGPGWRRRDGRPASLGRWNRIIQDIAGEHGVYVALAQLVGFEGGKAFPGGSHRGGPRGASSSPRADLRGGAGPGDPGLRGDHPRPRRPAAARRPGDAAAAPAGIAAPGPPREEARVPDRGQRPAARTPRAKGARPRQGREATARSPSAGLGPATRSRSTRSSPAAGSSSSSGTRYSAAAASRRW